jgi:hypothetical protein
VNKHFSNFERESLDAYLKCDAFAKHQPLEKKSKKTTPESSGKFTRAWNHHVCDSSACSQTNLVAL